jgi:hypothetical protein
MPAFRDIYWSETVKAPVGRNLSLALVAFRLSSMYQKKKFSFFRCLKAGNEMFWFACQIDSINNNAQIK